MRIGERDDPHGAGYADLQIVRQDKEAPVDTGEKDAFLDIVHLLDHVAPGSDLFKELTIKIGRGRIGGGGEVDHREAGEFAE